MIKYLVALTGIKFILVLVIPTFSQAQKRMVVETDTTLLKDYAGKLSFSYLLADGNKKIKDGSVLFNSELKGNVENRIIGYTDLSLRGQFREDIKDGHWRIEYNRYYLMNPKMHKGNQYRLNYQLTGEKQVYLINFSGGKRNRKWAINTSRITDGRPGRETNKSVITFQNDTLAGDFLFNMDIPSYGEVKIKGEVNPSGFLDGILEVIYKKEGRPIKERRIYEDGFLLSILQSNSEVDSIIQSIEFHDVQNLLDQLDNGFTNSIQIIKDSIHYPILFNINYSENDERIVNQKYTNEIILKAFGEYDAVNNLFEVSAVPFTGLNTRRFKYIYPRSEIKESEAIRANNEKINELANNILSRPKFILRKSESEDLTKLEALITQFKSKAHVIDSVNQLITSGYFDYINRSEYFKNGIFELSGFDSIQYEFRGKIKFEPVEYGVSIINHKDLLTNFLKYQEVLFDKLEKYNSAIAESLVQYEEQDKIDSLEEIISFEYTNLDSLYQGYYSLEYSDSNELPFTFKMFKSVKERLINPLNNKYLNDSLGFKEAVETANDLICLVRFLNDHKSDFDRIDNLRKFWADSVFIIYQENPFDYRKFETRVLGGIQSASNILLQHFATNLLNSKSCESLNSELIQIYKLEKRVLELRESYNTENVQILDRNLRRERVPQRISRILEL